ncbi:MAG TPA: hypothetical protein VFE85_07550 [Woeseiaceae bacterium]|nr:hypothetical protein [Woeseiaceae bacterium]
MVPPLVMINAKYYGARVALYIAGIMYVSIAMTALAMHAVFGALDIMPVSNRQVAEVTRFAIDYTLGLNILFVAVAGILIWLHRRFQRSDSGDSKHAVQAGITVKRFVALLAAAVLASGALLRLVAGI